MIDYFNNKLTVSIVTPMFNEELNIENLVVSIAKLFEVNKIQYEHIIVDNFSTDNSVNIIKELMNRNNMSVKLITNSKNYGPDFSPYIGFCNATGNVIIPVVADFQDPIEVIMDLINDYKQDENIDLICAVNKKFDDVGYIKKIFLKLFYFLLYKVSNKKIEGHFQGFGLYSANLVKKMTSMPYRYFFFRGLALDCASNLRIIEYNKGIRTNGKSTYSMFKLLKHGIIAVNFYLERTNFDVYFLIVLFFLNLLLEFTSIYLFVIILIFYKLRKLYTFE